MVLCFLFAGLIHSANAQTELAPWGNIMGVRIDGQLMEFETSLRVVKGGWKNIQSTGKEKQRPNYTRKGTTQIVTTTIEPLAFTKEVEEKTNSTANVRVKVVAQKADTLDGVFLALALSELYSGGTVQAGTGKATSLNSSADQLTQYLRTPVQSIRFASAQRQLQLNFAEPTMVVVKKETDKKGARLQFYIPVHSGNLLKDATAEKTLTLKASGTVDRKPVALQINTTQTGRPFDGFGGNFRIQNPRTDPQVIDYSLQNLRLAWSRVEMPWRFWQPQKNSSPIDSARNGKLNQNVQRAMEMAQRLNKLGVPVILSAWSAPAWAIVGAPRFRPGPDGVWGNPLNKDSTAEIYKSIGDYVVYLKEQYGVEINMFSFNESDLGINIRQTGEEHAELIKGLGAHFAQRGLKTKMLLGDNSDATTYEFIYPALNDPSTHPYIGAVSFHSWRGWETEILQKWADAATKINRPLIVGEGSIDAQAWGYPAVFEEPTYALEEINLYTRILAICQPASILQWQLTADYSPLVGGGIFGNNEPLRPTQRFWNLKQLASTPKDVKWMAARSDKKEVSVAAMGDAAKGIYTVHLVNNGPTRVANLAGLPASVKTLRVFVTDKQRAMKEEKSIPVSNGKASFTLETGTYTSLMNQ